MPQKSTLTENTSVAEMKEVPVTAEEEYNKNRDLKKEEISLLRAWMKTQQHLPIVNDEQLILFHHSCYYNMAATKACIEVYYTLRTNTPEFFNNRELTRPELQQALQTLEYGCLPKKDPNGYQIIFHRLHQFEASKYVFNDGVKLLMMGLDACSLVEGTVPGYVFLFDMRGVRLGHLTRLSISSLKKFFTYIQEGIPVRLKAIHVLNTHSLIDKIMFLIKPFIKKELMNLIHFHSADEMDKVYEVLPKNCLPSDYGGEVESAAELHANYIQWMGKLHSHWNIEQEYRVDETKRVNKKNKHHAAPAPDISLKTLELD